MFSLQRLLLHEPAVRSPGFSRSRPPEGGTPNKWRHHGLVHGRNACENRKGVNLPGHRFSACLGKAALKPHALQTLRDRRASSNRAKRLECVRFIRFIGAFRPARDGRGSWSQCTILKSSSLSTKRPFPSANFCCRCNKSLSCRFVVPRHAKDERGLPRPPSLPSRCPALLNASRAPTANSAGIRQL